MFSYRWKEKLSLQEILKEKKGRIMLFGKYVNGFYKKYWYDLVLGVLFLIVVDVAQMLLPRIIGNVVNIFGNYDPVAQADAFNQYQPLRDNFFTAPITDPNGFSFMMAVMAAIAVIIFIGRAGWRFAINGLGIHIDYDLKDEMFAHAEQLSVSYYKTQKTGKMMEYFNSDLDQVKSAFTEGTISLVDFLVLGGLSLYNMFTLNWQMSLICLIPMMGIAVTGLIVGKINEKKYKAMLDSSEEVSDFAQEEFSGISVVKAFVREKFQLQEFKKRSGTYRDRNLAYTRFSLFLDSIYGIFINSVFVITLLAGVQVVKSGAIKNDGTPFLTGDLVSFVSYIDALIWPMFAISNIVNILSRSYASLKKVTAFLDTPVDLKDVPVEEGKNLPEFNGDIMFKDFNFAYPDNTKSIVLQNISLHIKPGDNIGIVGRTGSGKSTLVKVLLKIYNIPEGHLYFNGVDINQWPSKTIRHNIGYVAQNAFLFSDEIQNNIAFSEDTVDPTLVRKAASFAVVDKSIESFKDGYQTVIGERGTTLSGGQKQRIAMARAIINNPPVLILDDSVSAVDSDTEKQILKNIRDLRKGKTTFIVSSRISSIENMDNIIVMDKGEIVGVGDHEELMATCPLYQDIVRLQELEKETR